MKTKYISVPEAAKKSGFTRQWIHKLLQQKRIDAIRIGNRYVIPIHFKIRPLEIETRGRKRKNVVI